ncbi:LacI family transcriptional regulator [Desulfoluna limicola]|uniref:Ribose operon repressor n=1 Tax=Desulfoluna limicola TaxID=2810562 RepID=A0ABM7PIC9_9BACT|nr:substrate-binding domain-containing protein [Desulfoluna limicola]BCS97045.1 LacI family transcriptional regulator [Desulfoluna limicola]
MATIKDVAKRAGVSTSTVSHVLNGTRYVSKEITGKVMQAVEALNYRPSSIARSLKVNKTGTIGMLVNTSTNPFYAEVVHGVEKRCFERGYTLFLCNTEGDIHRMEAHLRALEEKRVDGLLLMCSETDNAVFDLFATYRHTPIVVTDWGPPSENMDRIQDNSHHGGALATNHLIENGHTAIGCVTGPLNKQISLERLDGFTQAMDRAGLPVNKEWIIAGDFGCEGGVFAMNKLLALPTRPTALFVCNDMMALGVINVASRAGLSIPGDLSIVGYDDIFISRYMAPPLTTIHQPKAKLGAMAVDTLLDRISRQHEGGTLIRIEPHLVERDSVRNCKD